MGWIQNAAEWIVGLVTGPWQLYIMIGVPLVLLANLAWMYVVVLRAIDVNRDPEACRVAEPRIDLKKALRREISIPRLGLPLVIVASGLLIVQILATNWTVYWAIAIVWFVSAPLRKIWGIAVARRAYVKAKPGSTLETSLMDDVLSYWSWGFYGGSLARFTGRLKKWNWLRTVLVVLQFWRLHGVLSMAVASAAWPLSVIIAPFFHTERVDEYYYWHRPWWRMYRNAEKPPKKVVDSTAVETTGSGSVRRTTVVAD